MARGAARRASLRAETEEVPFDKRCLAWLQTEDAAKSASRVVKRTKLPLDPFELISEAVIKIKVKVSRDPEFFADGRFVTYDVGGYCTKIMWNHVNDLFSAKKRDRDRDRLLQADARVNDDALATPDTTEDERALLEEIAVERIDALRVVAEYSGEKYEIVSGVLTVMAIGRDPQADIGDSPTPQAGAKPDQARLWPAMWFAGYREKAFPVAGGSSQAQQKYRSNIGKRISNFLTTLKVKEEVDES